MSADYRVGYLAPMSLFPLILASLALAEPGAPASAPLPTPTAPAAANPTVPPPGVRVGQSAPQFVLPALNASVAQALVTRTDVALGDFVGIRPPQPARALVVTFVRKADGEAMLSTLQRIHRKHGKSGVRVVAILGDDTELATASSWVEGLRLEYPVLRDAYRVVIDRYGISTWPLTLVIDGEGTIDGIGVARENLETELDGILTASAPRK
jgi:hypothetical protein